MSGKNKKELKKSVKDCSSALQTFSEDFAEALRNNTLSNHLTEQADADLQMKVKSFHFLNSVNCKFLFVVKFLLDSMLHSFTKPCSHFRSPEYSPVILNQMNPMKMVISLL